MLIRHTVLYTIAGPGYYDVDPMIGTTVRSTKPSLPQYSLGLKNRDGDVNMAKGDTVKLVGRTQYPTYWHKIVLK